MPSSVAVIDIGSNSIKALVAQRTSTGGHEALGFKTIETRISAGISREQPRLSEEGMARGLEAVQDLLGFAGAYSPETVVLVATSAVRDAENGGDFRGKILSATGHPLRVLTGVEEVNYIGRGLTCDPALRGLTDFYSFDLGGGSLECLSFRGRTIKQAVSLPLGCVRLTEKCLAKPAEPFPTDAERRVAELTKEHLAKSGFKFDLPPEAVAVGTGGTLTTARAILGARRGKTFEASDTLITLGELRELAGYIGRVNLDDRKRLPAMPPGRADVLPTALTTMIALAEFGGFHAYRNSLYNLRWGIAAEALES